MEEPVTLGLSPGDRQALEDAAQHISFDLDPSWPSPEAGRVCAALAPVKVWQLARPNSAAASTPVATAARGLSDGRASAPAWAAVR